MADVMEAAKILCEKDAKTEQNCFGELLPCRKISPLEPFIKLNEYFMLERDTGKYLLYMAAIDRAISDIIQSNIETVNCFVLGPGLGRLVRFCLDSALHHGIPVCVHVMEANPIAVEFLKKSFEKEIDDEVVVLYDPFVFHPEVTASDLPAGLQKYCEYFHLIVSELLGCFGDDEFLPELTASLYKLFAKPKTGIMIPESWTDYLVPVSSPSTYQYLCTNNKCLNAGYTMGLPKDCRFLSEVKAAWSGDCKTVKEKYNCQLEFSLDIIQPYKRMSSQVEHCANTVECFHGDRCCQATMKSCQDDDERSKCCHGNEYTLMSAVQKYNSNDGNIASENGAYRNSEDASISKYDGTSCTDKNDSNIEKTKHFETNTKKQKSCHGDCESQLESHSYLHGFIGYFTSTLYKDIMIDTRHLSTNRNAFHWECYFVPLLHPIQVGQNSCVTLSMARKTHLNDDKTMKLWYEWQVIVENKQDLFCNTLETKQLKYNQEAVDIGSCTSKMALQDTLRKSHSTQENVKNNTSVLVCKHRFPLQNQGGDDDCVYLSKK